MAIILFLCLALLLAMQISINVKLLIGPAFKSPMMTRELLTLVWEIVIVLITLYNIQMYSG